MNTAALTAIEKCSLLWDETYEADVLAHLSCQAAGGKKRSRTYYHARENYSITEFLGVKRVARKKDSLLMVTKPRAYQTIEDIHTSLNHKGTWEKDTVAVLSGHGNFGRQLLRIGMSPGECEREYCPDCPGQIDTVEHRIRACPYFDDARTAPSEAVEADVTVCPFSRIGRRLGRSVDPTLLSPFNAFRDVETD
ncbi:unnamed protein product [Bemisia tabaci]|uniref:Reverse transcriptase n=1 Tax=Bemisia tabaci TaxID=7038 RepID=A0A9P0F4V9_BEMTA|nr:unnamed protein product [Bemisia tabaci]